MAAFVTRKHCLAAALTLSLAVMGGGAGAQTAQAFRKACSADLQKLCSGIQPGGGKVLQCLQSHAAELSPDCKAAYDGASRMMKERRG